MLTIKAEHTIHQMSRENPPAARAKSGDLVCFETLDCFGGQIQREDQLLGGLDWGNINPATGPLYVEDAMPGDVLKVEILRIELDDHGVMTDGPGEGVTGAAITDEATKILPVSGRKVRFNDKLAFRVSPMIGVIGTAPADGAVDTGTPGRHGGNMDCKKIRAGATLYLPVNVEGALLAMGDLHARMGDGEVEVCGVEIAGAVTVRVTVRKDCRLPLPFLVDRKRAMAICSAQTLDQAAVDATMAMHGFLTGELGLDSHEAGMLLSVAGNLRICQVVDPEKTCRMELPLRVIEEYGYHFA